MASKRYKQVFFLRFIAYFFAFTGSLVIMLILEPVIGAESRYRFDQIFNVKYELPPIVITSATNKSPNPNQTPDPNQTISPISTPTVGFGQISSSGDENFIKPKSTEFGIVIEKINANAKVIPQVDPADEKAYTKALQEGVAEALGSTNPGQPGNLFLFSHSTDAPWNIVRFNAVFYLLRELNVGDRIVIFYQGRRYDYLVYDKTIASPNDISFLSNRYDKPVLTLQTCDPPGTTLNRLIVRAKLAGT